MGSAPRALPKGGRSTTFAETRLRTQRRKCALISTSAPAAALQLQTATAGSCGCDLELRSADDASLARLTQSGNRTAFDQLVHRYDQAVLRLALHLLGSETEAQDICQEAFLKAYRHMGNFRFECTFYTWIYRIVTNLCLDHLRNRRTRKEIGPVAVNAQGEEYDVLAGVEDPHPGSNPERAVLHQELGTRIQLALRKLTPRERIVFELKHYHGLRLRTVGEFLNTTEDTVKSTLFRATQKLRTILVGMR